VPVTPPSNDDIALRRRQPYRADRAGPQPLGPVEVHRRILERQRRPGRRGRCGHGARRGPGGLDPHPQLVLRDGRAQAHAWPGALSQPGVDDAVRTAIEVLRAAGADVRQVSIPSHRDGVHLWGVIGTDGAFGQMLDGYGYGMNVPGLYDTELIEHFARGRAEHAAAMSVTLKMTTILGRYNLDRHGNRYYAMARNLALDLAAAYDAALRDVDVLVLPTLPVVAFDMPSGGTSPQEVMAITAGLMPNTCPFDVTGHPATTVPAGLSCGLPVGLMIVAGQLADAATLRVARAYEAAVGGFPAPPARH